VWQALRNELHPFGVEIVSISLELGDAAESQPFIEAAGHGHIGLLDPTHRMHELFGVVNIPNVVWIDEQGMIVRPAEPGWAGPTQMPADFMARMGEQRELDAKAASPSPGAAAGGAPKPMANIRKIIASGQDREAYPDAIRDWARHGSTSQYAMTPDEVIAASQPRSADASRGAAHFELAVHFWHACDRAAAIHHFNECHRLQPQNWSYKRQAWSLVGRERVTSDIGAFMQNPAAGHEADWPFISSFDADVAVLEAGQYYPKTL
jgi:hypothetical protein